MTAPGGDQETLVVRRRLAAPRERVFAAWLDPRSLVQWMRPMGAAEPTVEVDPRVGGRFRIVMRHGGREVEHRGEYLAIEPPARLEFTWISPSTYDRTTIVTVELDERDGGTELVLTHRLLPGTRLDAHRQGWTDIVRLLDETLARIGPA